MVLIKRRRVIAFTSSLIVTNCFRQATCRYDFSSMGLLFENDENLRKSWTVVRWGEQPRKERKDIASMGFWLYSAFEHGTIRIDRNR